MQVCLKGADKQKYNDNIEFDNENPSKTPFTICYVGVNKINEVKRVNRVQNQSIPNPSLCPPGWSSLTRRKTNDQENKERGKSCQNQHGLADKGRDQVLHIVMLTFSAPIQKPFEVVAPYEKTHLIQVLETALWSVYNASFGNVTTWCREYQSLSNDHRSKQCAGNFRPLVFWMAACLQLSLSSWMAT